MQEFEGELSGKFTGTIDLPDVGNGDPPPGNGGAPPAAEEPYHWYQDGADLSILVGDQKLNDKLLSAQAVYRGGVFSGHIVLDKSAPQASEPIMVFPRGDHFEFKTPGLANAGVAFGTGWYSNKSGHDGFPVHVQWQSYGLKFLIPDPKDSGRLRTVKKGYPTTWETYGLFLSWTVAVP